MSQVPYEIPALEVPALEVPHPVVPNPVVPNLPQEEEKEEDPLLLHRIRLSRPALRTLDKSVPRPVSEDERKFLMALGVMGKHYGVGVSAHPTADRIISFFQSRSVAYLDSLLPAALHHHHREGLFGRVVEYLLLAMSSPQLPAPGKKEAAEEKSAPRPMPLWSPAPGTDEAWDDLLRRFADSLIAIGWKPSHLASAILSAPARTLAGNKRKRALLFNDFDVHDSANHHFPRTMAFLCSLVDDHEEEACAMDLVYTPLVYIPYVGHVFYSTHHPFQWGPSSFINGLGLSSSALGTQPAQVSSADNRRSNKSVWELFKPHDLPLHVLRLILARLISDLVMCSSLASWNDDGQFLVEKLHSVLRASAYSREHIQSILVNLRPSATVRGSTSASAGMTLLHFARLPLLIAYLRAWGLQCSTLSTARFTSLGAAMSEHVNPNYGRFVRNEALLHDMGLAIQGPHQEADEIIGLADRMHANLTALRVAHPSDLHGGARYFEPKVNGPRAIQGSIHSGGLGHLYNGKLEHRADGSPAPVSSVIPLGPAVAILDEIKSALGPDGIQTSNYFPQLPSFILEYMGDLQRPECLRAPPSHSPGANARANATPMPGIGLLGLIANCASGEDRVRQYRQAMNMYFAIVEGFDALPVKQRAADYVPGPFRQARHEAQEAPRPQKRQKPAHSPVAPAAPLPLLPVAPLPLLPVAAEIDGDAVTEDEAESVLAPL